MFRGVSLTRYGKYLRCVIRRMRAQTEARGTKAFTSIDIEDDVKSKRETKFAKHKIDCLGGGHRTKFSRSPKRIWPPGAKTINYVSVPVNVLRMDTNRSHDLEML